MNAVSVGSTTAQKVYTPDQNMDVRGVIIQNTSANSVLFVATFTWASNVTPVNSTASYKVWPLAVSTSQAQPSWLELSLKTTFYALFETGASTGVVRTLEKSNDQSRTR